jgi:hypothetical protein
MSLRTSMLVVKDKLLSALVGPNALDVAVHQVTIRTRTWLGGAIDAPAPTPGGPCFTDSDLPIPQKYQVRQLTTEEVDESGGAYEVGDLLVKGIVPADPANPGVGFYPTQLAPVIVQGQEVIYVVVGPHNGNYALRELRSWGILSYDLILTRREDTPVVVQPDASGGEPE